MKISSKQYTLYFYAYFRRPHRLTASRKYGLEKEYEEARNYGLTVLEVLEEWNLIDDDFISKFGHFEDIKKPVRFKHLKKAWQFIESIFSR